MTFFFFMCSMLASVMIWHLISYLPIYSNIYKHVLDLVLVREINMQKKTNITCSHCGYSWDTKSTLIYVTCPSCRGNVKNPTDENCKGGE